MDTEMETCFEPIKAQSQIIARKEHVQQIIAQLNQLPPDMKKGQFESLLLYIGISENAPKVGTPVTDTEQLRKTHRTTQKYTMTNQAEFNLLLMNKCNKQKHYWTNYHRM